MRSNPAPLAAALAQVRPPKFFWNVGVKFREASNVHFVDYAAAQRSPEHFVPFPVETGIGNDSARSPLALRSLDAK